MKSVSEIGEDRRERFRHEARVNSLRVRPPVEANDVAYTEEDRKAWLESIKGEPA